VISVVNGGNCDNVRVDGGYLDLKIEQIDTDSVLAAILTELPPDFPLETADTIELSEDEILYKATPTEH
jgi:hypothetical protein